MKKIVLLLAFLLLPSLVFAQVIADDRRGSSVTLDTVNEPATVKVAGYQKCVVIFSSNSSFNGVVAPIFSYNNGASYETSSEFKFLSHDTAAGTVNTTLDSAAVAGAFTLWPGLTSPTQCGVRVVSYVSGSVVAQMVAVSNVNVFSLLMPNGVSPWDLSLGGLKDVVQNMMQIAGQSAVGAINPVTLCTGQFNVTLDTDVAAKKQVNSSAIDPASSEYTRVCEFQALIAAATGSANVWAVEGTGADCVTGEIIVRGPWRISATGDGTPGLKRGIGSLGMVLRTASPGKRLCFKTDSATAIQVDGLFAVHD